MRTRRGSSDRKGQCWSDDAGPKCPAGRRRPPATLCRAGGLSLWRACGVDGPVFRVCPDRGHLHLDNAGGRDRNQHRFPGRLVRRKAGSCGRTSCHLRHGAAVWSSKHLCREPYSVALPSRISGRRNPVRCFVVCRSLCIVDYPLSRAYRLVHPTVLSRDPAALACCKPGPGLLSCGDAWAEQSLALCLSSGRPCGTSVPAMGAGRNPYRPPDPETAIGHHDTLCAAGHQGVEHHCRGHRDHRRPGRGSDLCLWRRLLAVAARGHGRPQCRNAGIGRRREMDDQPDLLAGSDRDGP